MRISAFTTALLAPLISATDLAPNSTYLFSNPEPNANGFRVPSIRESALQARRILHLQGIATFSTLFPASSSSLHATENRPDSVAHTPIGLMEYYALCAPSLSDPTFIGITIATTFKNAAAGSNVSLALRYHLPLDAPQPPPDLWAYIPANLPRFSLTGYIERFSEKEVEDMGVDQCFFEKHPDAKIWAPGSDIHDAWYGRLRVQEIYFFGGFGDRARIGWIPLDLWQSISQKEIEEYRLVGEKGYKPSYDDEAKASPLLVQGEL
jgi:hypothetical protein